MLEFVDASPLAVFVGFAVYEKEVKHRFFAEQIPQFLAVNVWLALLGAAVGGHDQDFGLRFAVFDELYPFFDKALLRAFARLPNDEVDGGRAEEELVSGTVDALAAKIPAIERNFLATIHIRSSNSSDFDAMRGGMFLPILTLKSIHQTSFAYLSFANENELGFIKPYLRSCFG